MKDRPIIIFSPINYVKTVELMCTFRAFRFNVQSFHRNVEKSITMTCPDDDVTICTSLYICTVSFACKTFSKFHTILMLHS